MKPEFDRLMALSKGTNFVTTRFGYLSGLSCVGSATNLITSCARSTSSRNKIQAGNVCVMILNSSTSTISANINASFIPLAAVKISLIVILVIVVAALVGLCCCGYIIYRFIIKRKKQPVKYLITNT